MGEISIDQLVADYKSGNHSVFDKILEYVKPTIEYYKSKFWLPDSDEEDIEQICMIKLWNVIDKYDPEKNCSFKSYISKILYLDILTRIRNSNRKKHSFLNESEDIDNIIFIQSDPKRIVENRMMTNYFIDQIKKSDANLSSLEMDSIILRVKGKTNKQISEHLNVKLRSVQNAVQRSRVKLKAENIDFGV